MICRLVGFVVEQIIFRFRFLNLIFNVTVTGNISVNIKH